MRFSIVYSPSRCRRVTRFRDRKIVNGMPPNLLAHYLYLGETTVVRQAIETARTSVSSGGHSSSYWCQQRHHISSGGASGVAPSIRRLRVHGVTPHHSSVLFVCGP